MEQFLLLCRALSSPTLCRFIPALSLCPLFLTKNDCERNAAKRYLADLRREHPHLKIIVTEDALSSNAPHILELQQHDLRYILGVKPKDHEYR